MLLQPWSHDLVYSTCSLDPCENEAVVAELLRRAPWLELDSYRPFANFGRVSPSTPGFNTWDILDQEGHPYARK